MQDQKRGIINFEKYIDFSDTVSDFAKAYEYGITGLTDIDASYEKNGYIVWFEGKWITTDNFDIPFSQVQTLYAFNQKRGCKSYVVAHRRTNNGINYWICSIDKFVKNARRGKPDKTTVLRVNIENMTGPFTQRDFWGHVRKIIDPIEKYQKLEKDIFDIMFSEFI